MEQLLSDHQRWEQTDDVAVGAAYQDEDALLVAAGSDRTSHLRRGSGGAGSDEYFHRILD